MPSGSQVSRSFSECTARSILPTTSASSISLANRPLPPISPSRRCCIRSPVVRMVTISIVPGAARAGWAAAKAPATRAVCRQGHRAAAGTDAERVREDAHFSDRPCSGNQQRHAVRGTARSDAAVEKQLPAHGDCPGRPRIVRRDALVDQINHEGNLVNNLCLDERVRLGRGDGGPFPASGGWYCFRV